MQYASKELEANKSLNDWGGKGQSQYWDFILEMQVKILGVTDKYSNELSKCEEYKQLRKMANEGKYDRDKVLNAMIDMFNPNMIIILNWDEYTTFASKNAKKIADGCVGEIKWEYHELELQLRGYTKLCLAIKDVSSVHLTTWAIAGIMIVSLFMNRSGWWIKLNNTKNVKKPIYKWYMNWKKIFLMRI